MILDEVFKIGSINEHFFADLNKGKTARPNLAPPKPISRANFRDKFFD